MDSESSQGSYGSDGEFYPSSSNVPKSNERQYSTRPDINYSVKSQTGIIAPQAVDNSNDKLSGYSGVTKYCKFCGKKIPEQAVICTYCGCQVEEMKQNQPSAPVIVNNNISNNNNNNNNNISAYKGTPKNKTVALLLCIFGGCLGLHRFYEGKVGTGLLYLFTMGLCGFGVIIDLLILLTKSNPYYVK